MKLNQKWTLKLTDMETEKTVLELYKQFCSTYTIDQVDENEELQTLHQYLQEKYHMAGGNYIHIHIKEVRELIKKYLNYSFV